VVRASALINHYGCPSTSEVGLNIPPHRGSALFVPVGGTNRNERGDLVPVGATNRHERGHWYRFLSPTGTKGLCFPPF